AQTLFNPLHRHARWHEVIATQEAALEAARNLGDQRRAAVAHRTLGTAYSNVTRFDQAHEHLAAAITLFQEAGDTLDEAKGLLSRAVVFCQEGRVADGLQHGKAALALFVTANDPVALGFALNSVAWFYAEQKVELPEAVAYCRQAIALQDDVGDPH